MANYSNVFGNQTLPPSEFKYQALALTADTTCYWPYNYTGTGTIVAKINVISSTGAYTITMPSAAIVSTGEDVLFINNSSYLITLHDSAGGVIGTVAAGVSKYLYLMDNSTAAGVWGIFTFGTGTSQADASALAGYGTVATGATLSASMPMTESALAIMVDATTGRAQGYTFTGGSVACTFPSAVTAGSSFYFYVKNGGTGTITLTPVGGQTVDDVATLGLNPQESCFVVSSGAHWHTVGLGRSTIYQFTKLVKDLTGLSAYTLTSSDASNKLLQFTGAPSAAATITVPAVVSIYYVEVSTSNAYTVTLKTSAGTGVALAQNARSILYCDGVNVVSAQTASTPAAATTVTNDTATNSTMYPVWVTASAGDLPTFVSSTKLSFNPSTGVLTITGLGLTTALANTMGGTGKNSSGWTGLAKIAAGTWSAGAAGSDYVAPSAYASANGLTIATARLLGRTTAATGAAEEITVGSGLTLSAGSLSATATTVTIPAAAHSLNYSLYGGM